MVRNGIFWTIGEQSYIFIILLYLIEGLRFIGLKQLIWEDPTVTMMSAGQFCWNNSGNIVLIVRYKILL